MGQEPHGRIHLFYEYLVMKLQVHLIGRLVNFLVTVSKVLQLKPNIVTKALVIEQKVNLKITKKNKH